MKLAKPFNLYLKRLLLVLLISFVGVWIVSEVGILLQHESARSPEAVELIIPAGTAAKVAAGEPVPSIPDELNFVLGDTLLVRNEDSEAHVLGPLLVPPGSSASMPLDSADHYALTCSFAPSKYLGLNVRTPTTLATRLLGIGFALGPTAVVLFIYSLLVYPVVPKDDGEAPALTGEAGG